MIGRDVVVVGASAGAVRVLCALVASLPADLPAAVVVVLHAPPSGAHVLATILDRSGPMPARVALDGERLQRGVVLLAPPGRGLTLGPSPSGPVVSLSPAGSPGADGGVGRGTHRPRADALLLSAASALGPRVVAVVLSGDGDDGARGTASVLAAGGAAVVQEPGDALHPSMPRAALAATGAARSAVVVVPASGLGAAVAGLTRPASLARAS